MVTKKSLVHNQTSQKESEQVMLALKTFFVIFPILLTGVRELCGRSYRIPSLARESYAREADINIGILHNIFSQRRTEYGDAPCDQLTIGVTGIQTMQAVVFAVESINRNPEILPNITLDFVFLDACSSDNLALAQSLAFLSSLAPPGDQLIKTTQASSLSSSSSLLQDGGLQKHYKVIGVLTPSFSSQTIPISMLHSSAHIPVMSHWASSDQLSEKTLHRYFARVIPPDVYQVRAMLSFIQDQGWSYISVLYQKGSYGEHAWEKIRDVTSEMGICIATSHRVTLTTNMEPVAKQLLEFPQARVVILYVTMRIVRNLFKAIRLLNATGHFIWIGSDAWARTTDYFTDYQEEVAGSFVFAPYAIRVPEFEEYFSKLRLDNSDNPFLPRVWEKLGKCSVLKGTCNISSPLPNVSVGKFVFTETTSLLMDTVYALALAADHVVRETCPFTTGEAARGCISGPGILQSLLNLSFDGYTGHIRFDAKGDAIGRYQIKQVVLAFREEEHSLGEKSFSEMTEGSGQSNIELNVRSVAFYDILQGFVTYANDTNDSDIDSISQSSNESTYSFNCLTCKDVHNKLHPISWFYFNDYLNLARPTHNTLTPVGVNVSRLTEISGIISRERQPAGGVPESVCSRKCLWHEYKILRESPCCWDCHTCRDNEKIIHTLGTCQACPAFMWPDPAANFTDCMPIAPTHPSTATTVDLVLACLGAALILITLLVASTYVVFRNIGVIKASSRELSFLQLSAILLGYITVICLQTTPTPSSCRAIYFMFCLSFCWLYASLLVKAVRIYRIFHSSSTFNRRLRLVSPHAQVLLTCGLMSVQMLLCIVVTVLYSPTAVLTQAIPTEPVVELSCDMTVPGLASFLAYNLLQVALCSVFAFKTRHLPDNFNDSRFISMCVSTTLVIWLAFIPTFLTTDRQSVKALLLSVALLFNHSVALFFLFAPKLYAAAFYYGLKQQSETAAAGVSWDTARAELSIGGGGAFSVHATTRGRFLAVSSSFPHRLLGYPSSNNQVSPRLATLEHRSSSGRPST